MIRRMIATALVVAGLACGTGRVGPNSQRPASPDELTVEIENRHFSDATVYAVAGGARQRLGRVSGKTTKSFSFRWPPEQLRMLVDFTGAGQLLSDRLAVHPGTDDLLLIISAGNALWIGRKTR